MKPNGEAATRRGTWAAVLLPVLTASGAYVAYGLFNMDWPGFPPRDVNARLMSLMLPVAALAAVALAQPGLPRRSVLLWVVLAALTPSVLVRPVEGASVGWSVALGSAAALLMALVLPLERRRPAGTALGIGIVAAATAPCLLAGYYASLVPVSAALAAGLGVTFFLVATIGKKWRPAGVVPLSAIMLIGLWTPGHFFGYMSAAHVAALAASVVLLWIGELPLLRHVQPWRRETVRITIAALPALAAAVHAVKVYLASW